mmetsp:Transcript_26311/g.40764  ORF Transcript_26311/g.40764 Transcript_26311/m.40764 type:complete len:120 (+) Transcript_26311:175-534(+)|eukprot:CAMPEP_0196815480 /NCGR_PEP_ID=MMETSP1362-20130617/50072_1 /TAXON_ID=163516 /ORGANISM="Leptocylindrus danicus, Strain CCMP1856" /LENGTH=119 /DNA_ID=CAMNT_0042192453 /DNA_START=81 /DNA_END=440 /DNA_ORIENTATION=-
MMACRRGLTNNMTASLLLRHGPANYCRRHGCAKQHGFQSRFKSSRESPNSSSSSEKVATEQPQSTKQEPEAKGWLKRMAPPKGGTDPPDAKFLAVAAVVCGAGFYAWFIDPPKRAEEEQ